MTHARMIVAAILALAPGFGLGAPAQGQSRQAAFEARPAATKAGDRTKLAFSITAPADVEVAVLDARGKVVKHLAAGLLGASQPPPEPLRPGLSQALEWDGKDDLGRPAAGAPFRFRVRVGMAVNLGGFQNS